MDSIFKFHQNWLIWNVLDIILGQLVDNLLNAPL